MAQPPPEARALPDPPTDGITQLSYLPATSSNASLLTSSSWDGSIRIHDTSALSHVCSHSMESGPLLSLATPVGDGIFTGGLDGSGKLRSSL